MSGFEDYIPKTEEELAATYLRDRKRRFVTGRHIRYSYEQGWG
jgi:hypothetical protein